MIFEVWTEGYAITGNRSGAIYHGTFEGETFRDAVGAFKSSIKDDEYIDLDDLTYWGCRFFDNKLEASKSFG